MAIKQMKVVKTNVMTKLCRNCWSHGHSENCPKLPRGTLIKSTTKTSCKNCKCNEIFAAQFIVGAPCEEHYKYWDADGIPLFVLPEEEN